MYALSSVTIPDGIAGTNVTTYTYNNALMHRGGRGFLGFASVTSNSLSANATSVTQSLFASPWYSPTTVWQNTSVGSSNVSMVANYFDQIYLGPNHFAIEKLSDYSEDLLAGTATQNDYVYDQYNNVVNATTNVNGIENTSVATNYCKCGTPVPAKPVTVSINKTRTGSPTPYSNSVTNSYDAKGHVRSQTPGQTCGVTYGYSYDGFGNRNIVNSSLAAGGGPREQIFNYDNNGRFPLTISNTLQEVTTIAYNDDWGKPASITGVDGKITTYTYDAYGRLVNTYTPRHLNVVTTYDWETLAPTGSNAKFSINVVQPGRPTIKIDNDALGREVIRKTIGFGGNWLTSGTTYTNLNKPATVTAPHYTWETPAVTTYQYDYLNRPYQITDEFSNTNTITYTYSGGNLNVQTTDAASRSATTTTDATGKVISSSDNGGTLTFKYDSYGNKVQIKNGSTTVLSLTYDACNNKTSATEPNAGYFTYIHDGYGQVLEQIDGDGKKYDMLYDAAGRITQQAGPPSEGTSYYSYVNTGYGINNIYSIEDVNGNWQYFTYDEFSNVIKAKDIINGTTYETDYGYDATYGNNTSITYPSTVVINSAYDTYGYLTSITDYTTGHTLYTVNEMNSYGQATNYTTGNGKTSTLTTNFGVPTQYYTPIVQDLNMTYDWTTADLTSRQDNITGNTETFTYDNNDRLTSARVNSNTAMNFTFQTNGNLATKTDVGSYGYDNTKINAVNGVSNDEGNISTNTQTITYVGFNKASKITENGNELDYTYGADFSRKTSVLKNSGGTVIDTRIYSGTYEEDNNAGTLNKLHYIYGNNGLIAIIVKDNSGVTSDYYTYTDHLGSILTVTDNSATVVASQNFDAWGRNRNPVDWSYSSIPSVPPWLYRGYTGHEMLPLFGLINMNGRMYDPLLGRMLSPDNDIQGIFSTQGYNRYSYVSNNPLKYNDPSGWDDNPCNAEGAMTWGGFDQGWCDGGMDFNVELNGWAACINPPPPPPDSKTSGGGIGEPTYADVWGDINSIHNWGSTAATNFGNTLAGFWNQFTSSQLFHGPGKEQFLAWANVLASMSPHCETVNINNPQKNDLGEAIISTIIYCKSLPGKSSDQFAADFGTGSAYVVGFGAVMVFTDGVARVTMSFTATVDAGASTALANYYPANGGALGEWTSTMSQVGQKLDRFGPEQDACYLSPAGTPFEMRALPGKGPYYSYTVAKPFPMQQSTVAPAFGQMGMGTQYQTYITVEYLVEFGYLVR